MGPLRLPLLEENRTMSLGIIAAMDREGRALAGRRVPAGDIVRIRQDEILLVAGIGPDRARIAARILLENGAAALLSWGFACSLQPDIMPGEIVIPGRVVAADGSVHMTDQLWREKLCRRLGARVPVRGGCLAESCGILDCSAKDILGRQTGAVASDMESASIAAAASKAGVRFLAIRSITDTPGMRVPSCAANCVDNRGRVMPIRLLSGLLHSPADLPAVIRLGRNYQAATKSLRSVAAHGGKMFCLNGNETGHS
jgi:adenosylhomocysteine nucleosidase